MLIGGCSLCTLKRSNKVFHHGNYPQSAQLSLDIFSRLSPTRYPRRKFDNFKEKVATGLRICCNRPNGKDLSVGALERVNLVVLLVRWLEAKQFHLGSGLEEPAIRSISCSSACTLGGSRHTLYLCRNPVEFEPSKK